MACGDMGLGDFIWEMESGRPLGTERLRDVESRRDSRREEEECWEREEEEECFDDEEELDLLDRDEDEDFSTGTSRMFRTRPVVGSVVEAVAGSWDTW